MSQENVRVRGYTSYNRPASGALIALSRLLDLCIIALIGAALFIGLNIEPIPSFINLSAVLLGGITYFGLQRFLWGPTLGERAWGIQVRRIQARLFRPLLFQRDYLALPHVFTSTLITTLMILVSFASVYHGALRHPYWLKAAYWELDPFLPADSKEWLVTPFYYGISGWPRLFNNRLVYYTLPYEPGPPAHFVGKFQANWESPDIKVIIEGPKTPPGSVSRKMIRECVLNLGSYECLTFRESALSRHVKEIEALSPRFWKLRWFAIKVPEVSLDEFTQGIYLQARGGNWIQDRFIMINAQGSHQTIILKRPLNAKGEQAFALLEKSIRSMRSFHELESGRAWIDRELEKVKLDSIANIKDPAELVFNFFKVQSLLLSKISVEPNNFASYYHLAGTSSLVLRKLRESTGDTAPTPETYRSFAISSSVQNLDSAYRYAKDLSPNDPRMQQIQSLWLESKKWK